MATDYSLFVPEIAPDVVGCPDALIVNAVRNAAIEFCEKSWAWIYQHAAISAVANQGSYPFVPPAGAKVVRVLQAWYDGKHIYPKDHDELSRLYVNWRTEAAAGPDWYTQDNPDNIILVPKPEAALTNALVLTVSLQPTRVSATVDDQIYERYLEYIAGGAKARLFEMEDRPWSNANRAKALKDVFETASADVRHRVQKGFVRSRQRVSAQFL